VEGVGNRGDRATAGFERIPIPRIRGAGALACNCCGRRQIGDGVASEGNTIATEPQAGAVVSSAALAKHFDCVPSYIRKLVEQGVIERRSDGRFDQDACRSKYLAHLREERQRSPKSAADTESQRQRLS
jgi:hypothetical protein